MKRLFLLGLPLALLLTALVITGCPTGSEDNKPEVIQSSAPTVLPANATVAKTNATQASIVFTLSSSNNGTWKVYGAASGGTALSNVTASFSGTSLTLSSNGTDLAAGDYWVTVTETDKTESARLKLTVGPYSGGDGGKTAMMILSPTTVQKTVYPQDAVSFNFAGFGPDEDSVLKVYSDSGAATLSTTVKAELDYSGTPDKLILKSITAGADVPDAAYYVTVTEPGKTESNPATLTVTQAKSTKPAVSSASIAKYEFDQTVITFALTSTHSAGTWEGYTALTDGTKVFTGTFAAPNLTLTYTGAETDIPHGVHYFIQVTEEGKSPSDRLDIVFTEFMPPVSDPPTVAAGNDTERKLDIGDTSVNFILSSRHDDSAVFKVYRYATGTETVAVTATYNSATDALTLSSAPDALAATSYYVSVTDKNKTESTGRLALAVLNPSSEGQTDDPVIPINEKRKDNYTSVSIDFELTAPYSASAQWRVYTNAAGTILFADVSAASSGTKLTLTSSAGPLASDTDYYVTVMEEDKNRSNPVQIRVLGALPGFNISIEFGARPDDPVIVTGADALMEAGDPLSITVKNDFALYEWILNDVVLTGVTGPSYSGVATKLGNNELTVIGYTANDVPYSTTLYFWVKN